MARVRRREASSSSGCSAGSSPARSPEHRYRVHELADMFGPLVLSPQIPERSALQQAQGASLPIHRWPGPAASELGSAFDAHLARVLRAESRPPRRRATSAAPEAAAV